MSRDLMQSSLNIGDRSILAGRWALVKRIVLRDPLLFLDYTYWYLRDRVRRAQQPIASPQMRNVIAPDEFDAYITRFLGNCPEGSALAQVRAQTLPSGDYLDMAKVDAAQMAGDAGFGMLVYKLVRAMQAGVVVETGVATGVTSAHVLAAMADNNLGELFSIDLPPTSMIMTGLVGSHIPPELRSRWHFCWGASHRLLPKVLKSVNGYMQIFIHDSDHRYANMFWELENAWAALAPGGWLVADDVQMNAAFNDLATVVGLEPWYVTQLTKSSFTGLLRKPE